MMLEFGFEKELNKIMRTHMKSETRKMCFSATVPKFIQEVASKAMKDPLLIDLVGTDTN